MNQILYSKSQSNNPNVINKSDSSIFNKKSFIIQFILCILIALSFIIYYIYSKYTQNEKDYLSHQLVDHLGITNLYSNNTDYNTFFTSTQNLEENSETKFDIIGMIEIKKLGINYPILSKITDDFLDIAPCKVSGPLPNQIGNLCIAAHNYNNFKHFSKINQLSDNDIISIYDLNGNKVDYSVYKNYEVSANDTECIDETLDDIKEITLITCNNLNNKRIIVKAKEK